VILKTVNGAYAKNSFNSLIILPAHDWKFLARVDFPAASSAPTCDMNIHDVYASAYRPAI